MSDLQSEDDAMRQLREQGLLPENGNGSVTSDFNPDEWEDIADDNGERMEWTVGKVAIGKFIGQRVLDLPEDKRNPDGGDTADILVFEDEHEERWFTWMTYQMIEMYAEGKFIVGDIYRFHCKAERKTKKGSVKVFDIRRRKVAQEHLL